MGAAGAGGWTGFGLPWGLLSVLLSVALFTVAVYLLADRVGERDARESADPMTTLERRYARGEIDESEFDERRTRLGDRTRL
jgi:putative membrane protein